MAVSRKEWFVFKVVVAALLIGALLLSLLWADPINRKLGLIKVEEGAYGGSSTSDALAGSTVTGEVGDDLNVHFLDVGQADTCIIELPDDRNILIDAGNNDDKYVNYIKNYIKENIKNDDGSAITFFDYVILTHPDSDHCGGMAKVLAEYPAKKFFRPAVFAYNESNPFEDPAREIFDGLTVDDQPMGYEDVIKIKTSTLNNSGKYRTKCTVTYEKAIEAGYNLEQRGGITTQVEIFDENSVIKSDEDPTHAEYYSLEFYGPADKTYKDWNDYSPIMILEYHEKRIMLSGDAEKACEAGFVERVQAAPTDGKTDKFDVFDEDYTVDVIKLGHHGSRTSSSQAFLDVLTTEANRANVLFVISCGLDNEYGHPHDETLQRLKAMGVPDENVVGTHINGTIAMQIRADEGEVYNLYMGASMVRREAAAVGKGKIVLTWREIAIALCVVVFFVFFILPILLKEGQKSGGKKSGRKKRA